ncbi:hypothetical protein ABLE91_27250 [Aquabacter sp. CN5-332]|uniref:hypothetical protein n=1 Tax=Aquabacter sp. CN5-332 TaxID=3156608 RepID=UPI0032B436B9
MRARTASGHGSLPPRAWGACALLAGLLFAGLPARAQDAPISNLSQLGASFQACWKAPPGSAGSRITLRFGLTAKGELKGAPRATYSQLMGDRDAQRAFVAAALTALSSCTPVRMSPDLGRVVASRVLTVTYASGGGPKGVDI